MKNDIVLCCIAKKENLYINEFVKHYIGLGIDRIYLFDNNDKEEKDVLSFIDSKYLDKVECIRKNGIHFEAMQLAFYNEFYQKYGNTFDWCLFCDIDEFLVGTKDIKKWLQNDNLKNAKQIRIWMKLFGDDNLIERDMSIPVHEALKIPVEKCKNDSYFWGHKFIIRGGLENVEINSAHYASYKNGEIVEQYLMNGTKVDFKISFKKPYRNIVLNHYRTKTLKEFCEQKINRGDCFFEKREIDFKYYFIQNQITKEKIKWLRRNGYLKNDETIDTKTFKVVKEIK